MKCGVQCAVRLQIRLCHPESSPLTVHKNIWLARLDTFSVAIILREDYIVFTVWPALGLVTIAKLPSHSVQCRCFMAGGEMWDVRCFTFHSVPALQISICVQVGRRRSEGGGCESDGTKYQTKYRPSSVSLSETGHIWRALILFIKQLCVMLQNCN